MDAKPLFERSAVSLNIPRGSPSVPSTLELGPAHDTRQGLHNALAACSGPRRTRSVNGVLRAHPDLAGKLAAAKRLTAESTAEQASAGLDALTDDERVIASTAVEQPPMWPNTAFPSSSP